MRKFRKERWSAAKVSHYVFYFLAAGILGSCGRPPDIHYYTIDLSTSEQNSQDQETIFPFTVGVEKIDGGVIYTDDRIIYRQSAHEIKFWNYRRWIAPPNVLATEALREHLKASRLFENVVTYPSSLRPRMIFSGKVKAFEEWDQPGKWYGKVALELSLKDLKRGREVWEGYFEATNEVKERMPSAVVESINAALNRCLQEAVQDLKKKLQGKIRMSDQG